MKTAKKFQICVGIATPIMTALYIYFGFISFLLRDLQFRNKHYKEGMTNTEYAASIAFGVIFTVSLLVAIGAYQNAKGSEMGADLLLISGLIVIFGLGFWGLFVFIYGGLFLTLLIYAPTVLSAIAILMSRDSKENSILSIKSSAD